MRVIDSSSIHPTLCHRVSAMMEKQGNQAAGEKQGRKSWTLREFGGKTLWDWMGLLIVPVVLSLITVVFAWQQDIRQNEIEKKRAQQAQKIEGQRAEAERELAEQRADDEALQSYLDQMRGLLLERDLRASEKGSEVRTLARARTLTVLGRLDPSRKTALMQFLVDADLIQRVDGRDPIIGLSGADLKDAVVMDADLSGANLGDANLDNATLNADLRDAHLRGADLKGANLWGSSLEGAKLSLANLRDACLRTTTLSFANLSFANLSDTDMGGSQMIDAYMIYADLSDANLSDANLSDANLSRANLDNANLEAQVGYAHNAKLDNANLSDANLEDASVTEEQLEQAESLEGATMPNGQKYEDWLKSKGRGKDGKHSGTS
jgi:uncharacterized protein YjbI with pentapeptide repeats